MTQPPDGYPAPEPGHHPPPADPFYGPPSWEPPTQPATGGGGAPPPYQPPQPGSPSAPFLPPGPPPAPQSGPPGTPSGPPGPPVPYSGPLGPAGPYSGPPGPPQRPGSPPPYGPASGAPYGPGGPPPYGGPGGPPSGGMSPKRKKGLLILGAALAGLLVLCAGGGIGGWLLLRDSDRDGAATPTAAVQSFLQAVYRDHDPTAAAALVCSEARDEDELSAKIDEVRAYQDAQVDPRFQWTNPQVVEEGEELTVVAVTLTMITGDEKVAEQSMRVSVLDKDPHGWWVCNLETTDEQPADAGEDDGAEGGDDAEEGDDASADDEDDEESADD